MKTFAINVERAAVVFVALALVASGAALAGRDHRHHHHSERVVERVADDLSLNDAQRDRLQAMLRETAAERRRLREQTQEEMRALLSRDVLDKEGALRLLRLPDGRREQMRDFVAGQIAAFHAELDAEQREKFADVAPRLLKLYAGGRDGKQRRHRGDRRRNDDNDDRDDDDRDDDHRDDDRRDDDRGHWH